MVTGLLTSHSIDEALAVLLESLTLLLISDVDRSEWGYTTRLIDPTHVLYFASSSANSLSTVLSI